MKAALAHLSVQFLAAVTAISSTLQGDDLATVQAAAIQQVARFCEEEPRLGFTIFLSLCAVDRLLLPEQEPRFGIVYHLRQGREPWKSLHLKVLVPGKEIVKGSGKK